jgi:hypothetical protein
VTRADLTDADLAFYAAPGPMTDLREVDELVADLPKDPVPVAQAVQSLVLHRFWAEAYGAAVPADRMNEMQTRSARKIIERVVTLDPGPLVEGRPAPSRFLGNCRHFSTLTVALLRRAGVPSRARCGFANYFEKGKWVDHWVVEFWENGRWVLLDPQVDQLQRAALRLEVDPADLPAGYFLNAGEAWIECQSGAVVGDRFGIFDMWGQWFIKGNVVRDLAALNKVEMLPWDGWGAIAGAGTTGCDPALVDEIAALIVSDDVAALRRRYEDDGTLRVPSKVTSFTSLGPVDEEIPELVVGD